MRKFASIMIMFFAFTALFSAPTFSVNEGTSFVSTAKAEETVKKNKPTKEKKVKKDKKVKKNSQKKNQKSGMNQSDMPMMDGAN